MHLISEYADRAPFESQLTKDWALRVVVKCSLFKSGLLAPEVDAFFPDDLDENLWARIHTLLVSPFSGAWFREAVEAHHQRWAVDGVWRSSQIAAKDLSDEHPIVGTFITLAMVVQGMPIRNCSGALKDLLEIVYDNNSSMLHYLSEVNTQREGQVSLWLRDLVTHDKSFMRRGNALQRLRLKLGLVPRKSGEPLLHPPILIGQNVIN